ncbi:MAG TPA: hypothetical protein VMB71_16490 [Acetobacteraceae bacterium]|nr:hypothetical protein [Acetobacteraceae bacterium]
MTSWIPFPDWVPPWAQLLVLIVGIMLALAFLLMPFSVFGVKSRLEAVEARLDEIQGEIRALVLRLPEPSRRATYDDEPMLQAAPMATPMQERPAPARPPIPPAAWRPEDAPRRPIGSGLGTGRVEPRIGRGQ